MSRDLSGHKLKGDVVQLVLQHVHFTSDIVKVYSVDIYVQHSTLFYSLHVNVDPF
jgi:hypothetical protein